MSKQLTLMTNKKIKELKILQIWLFYFASTVFAINNQMVKNYILLLPILDSLANKMEDMLYYSQKSIKIN